MSSVAVIPPSISFNSPKDLRAQIESTLSEHLASTLQLRERAVPVTVPTGIAAIDSLTGGLPRAALTEIAGPTSSGRTGVMLSALAGATRRQEVCALVDASDSFDPGSAAAAGVDLERLLWVRCNQSANAAKRSGAGAKRSSPFAFAGVLEQVLKVTDLLLQSGGFGMVVLDMGDIPAESVRRVPLTSWFRFRRAVEPTATVLLLIEQEPSAKTCASLVLQLQAEALGVCSTSAELPCSTQQELQFPSATTKSAPALAAKSRFTTLQQTNVAFGVRSAKHLPPHATPLRGMRFRAEVVRSWANRKPPQSASANFELRAAR